MEESEIKYFTDSFARFVSAIFHPLFVPVYGLAIIFIAPTLMGYLPFEVKKILLLIVIVNNVMVPALMMPFFKHGKIITTWTIDDRKERKIPLLIASFLYAVTYYIVSRFPVPSFVQSFFISAFLLSLVVTLISFWWKISVHSVGAGALVALVLTLSRRMDTTLMLYLLPVIIIAGLILSSRLKLNSHSPAQVWTGLFTGFLGMLIFMQIYK
jgi:hypothetical protein